MGLGVPEVSKSRDKPLQSAFGVSIHTCKLLVKGIELGLTFAPYNPQDLLWLYLAIASTDVLVIFNTMADFHCNKAALLYWPFDGDCGGPSIK